MKLTSQHIQQLYQFTRQHYVEYYDVQTELVDHLANDIEKIWAENSKISFEEAKEKSFKKFGVFGFMNVVEERQKVLHKKYWKLVWNVFQHFFTIPHILITVSIATTLFLILKILPYEWVIFLIVCFIFSILLFRLYVLQKQKKKRLQISQKKWLLEEYIFNLGNFLVILNLFFQLIIQFNVFGLYSKLLSSNNAVFAISIVLTSIILLIYIITYMLPSKAEEILKQQYPEYKMI